MNEPRTLVQTHGIRHVLRYSLSGIVGTRPVPFLAQPTLDCLMQASAALRRIAPSRPTLELTIWDAHRSVETQQYIFESYVQELVERDDISILEARERAVKFVRSPNSVFPHGTGGAIDITLTEDGAELDMGTGFDEFTAKSAADWFVLHKPSTPREVQQAENRQILRQAMERAGFVVIPSEWWHFEWGTEFWSTSKNQEAVLTDVLV